MSQGQNIKKSEENMQITTYIRNQMNFGQYYVLCTHILWDICC
jgi:hypothetical protein